MSLDIINFLFLRMFIFELHVEKKLLIGNMDLAEAIGAFLHLSFVFDLVYVKVFIFHICTVQLYKYQIWQVNAILSCLEIYFLINYLRNLRPSVISGRGSMLVMGMTRVTNFWVFLKIYVEHFIINRIKNKWQEVLSPEQDE